MVVEVFLVLFLLYAIPSSNTLNINVHPTGSDVPECLNGSYHCKTLDYVARQIGVCSLSENINISIVGKKWSAESITSFQNLHNLTLISSSGLGLHGKLLFFNISGLTLKFKGLKSTGKLIKTKNHFSLLEIEACQDVTIMETSFSGSKETAIFLKDTTGNVILQDLKFSNNKNWETKNQKESHSGGIEIVFTGNLEANYKINDCTFNMNSAPGQFQSYNTTLTANSEWRGQGLGGGLGIFYQERSSNKTVIISGCSFINNKAVWGGGLHIIFQRQASQNSLQVWNSSFSRNQVSHGGGGVCIRYFKQASSQMNEKDRNVVEFYSVVFHQNNADFGGGLLILSTYSHYPSDMMIHFMNSEWFNNSALYGAAAVVSPALFQLLDKGLLPIPEFRNCRVSNNYLFKSHFSDGFAGIFIVTSSVVHFSGTTVFINNEDSALYLNSATIIFNSASNVTFVGNAGLRGGAIASYGYSSLLLNQNSVFTFDNNSANTLGGAIYHHSEDQHEYKYGRLCFIRHEWPYTNKNTIFIRFVNNSAGVLGQAIYSSTMYPCHFFKSSHLGEKDMLNKDILNFIGSVFFDNKGQAISTSSRRLDNTNVQSEYQVYPGGTLNLSLISIDDFNHKHVGIHSYNVRMKTNRTVHIDRLYTVRGILHFSGIQGAKDVLLINQDSPRQLTLVVNISLVTCPPGFYYENKSLTCKCTLNGTSNYFYYGIAECDTENFHVNLHPGFWIGYKDPDIGNSPLNLFTAACPLQFCKYVIPYLELPSDSSELSDLTCQLGRTGILCGDCKPGYAPFFHSKNDIKCGNDTLCSYGFWFYVLSELFPVFIMFTIIIALDLSLTSGKINGFLLYSQVLDSLLMKYKNSNDRFDKALIPSRIFYDIFNFDYFSVSPFSYCLWKNAKVVDILAFKYVTVVFAILLVLLLVLFFRKIKWKKLEKSCI